MSATEITAGDLSTHRVGQRIRVTTKHSVIEGVLRDVNSDVQWIEDARHGVRPDEWEIVKGSAYVRLTIGEWEATRVSPDARVEVIA